MLYVIANVTSEKTFDLHSQVVLLQLTKNYDEA